MENSNHFDVIVIGGGPAGTTAAFFLAEKGYSVCLLEKAHHPRFHIGESLLPMNLPILQRLGVLDKVHGIGIKKNAAEFNSTETERVRDTFYFSRAIDSTPEHAYQVKRAEFDEILFNNCVAKGVHALQGVCVTDVDLEQEHLKTVVTVSDEGEQITCSARYLIDASGRETFLASKLQSKQKNTRHQMAAIYGHYQNVSRRTGDNAGNISIYWFEQGWVWLIPLTGGIMSVGAVCKPGYLKTRNNSPEDFLSDTLHLLPELRERMRGARLLGKVQATGNYSYASSTMVGKGYLLVGDAYAFVDPVFSSGVYLAMQGAEDAAQLIDDVLTRPGEEKRLVSAYQRKVDKGIAAISWFIYRFNTPVLHHLLMSSDDASKNKWQGKMKASVISILSGDVYGNPKVILPLLMFKTLYYVLSFIRMAKIVPFVRLQRK